MTRDLRYRLAVGLLFAGFALFQLLAAATTGEIMIGMRTGSRWRSWESSPGWFVFGVLFWSMVAAFSVWIIRENVVETKREQKWLRKLDSRRFHDRAIRRSDDPQP